MRIGALLLVLAVSCDSPTVARAPDLARPRDMTAPRDLAPAADLAPPRVVEVELRGTVKRGAAPRRGRLVVVVTDGPCFESGSHYLATRPATVGEPWFIEVFPPWNSKIWVCAALLQGEARATPWVGHNWAPLLAVGEGEVEWNDLRIELKKAKPVTLPAGIKLE